MSYCIECGAEAVVCFCGTKKKTMGEYLEAFKECQDLKCYCKEHAHKTGR